MKRPELRAELLAMAAEDRRIRTELATRGELFQLGYHPRMEEVHQRHAARLRTILVEHGWPDQDLVGADGAEAGWLIAQHAIGDPQLQRQVLRHLERSAERGSVPRWQVALLEDRIRFFEGRLQRYGTQFDWDETGQLSPVPSIEKPEEVDARRLSVGLEPLAQALRRHREAAAAANELPPADLAARRRQMNAWARKVGWRD